MKFREIPVLLSPIHTAYENIFNEILFMIDRVEPRMMRRDWLLERPSFVSRVTMLS